MKNMEHNVINSQNSFLGFVVFQKGFHCIIKKCEIWSMITNDAKKKNDVNMKHYGN